MAEASKTTPEVTLDEIVALCKRRGFIFQASEIYGGLASTYDYGHYGVLLKNNVKVEWWRAMVGERDDIVLRLRPSYFPFTEPSAEVDVGWSMEKGRRVVGGSEGWMEVLGAGMVHRRVIANCGLDPDEWQGFAFGTGVDRLAMLKYGMSDLRAFFDGDLRWLKHYGFRALDVPTLSGGVGA
jgi:hypothetical protein